MYYKNQRVLLASKHAKEQAIAAPFEQKLACSLEVHDFDTDQFGTFTGEITRTHPPYETCLLKAKTAAEHYGYQYAVASEGSFGPHPAFPFVPSDHELMIFIDRQHHWTIAEQVVSPNTNYASINIQQDTEINAFLNQIQFPSHAVIVQSATNHRIFAKGIHYLEQLYHHIAIGFKTDSSLRLSTDMRAMMNPTRMAVISELANKLATRIATLCPQCSSPGFGFKSTRGSLACALCNTPTSFYAEEVWGCIACDHHACFPRQDGLYQANPTYCLYCNP